MTLTFNSLNSVLTVTSTILADLVAGTYSTVKFRITNSAGTVITTGVVIAGFINVDSYDLDSTLFGLTLTDPFPDEMYKIEILTGTDHDVVSDSGCILSNEDLVCTVYESVINNNKQIGDIYTQHHLIYQYLTSVTDCDGCSCDNALELYKVLCRELGDPTFSNTEDCGC